MVSKISFGFILVAFQIVSSYGDLAVDDSLKRICDAPAVAGKGTERIHMADVSKRSDIFLSKNIKKAPAICTGDSIHRFEVEEPSADNKVMNAARAAIGETSPKAVEAAKAKLVELLKKDSKLNVPLDNADWLVRFLRLRKYDVPATYELIKNYYNFKDNNRNIFNGLVPSKQIKFAETNTFVVLPNRDQNGRRIVVASSKNYDPKKFSPSDMLKAGVVLTEAGSYEPATQIAGVQMIFDASGVTFNQVKQFTPSMAKKIVDYFLQAAPFRYEGIHIVRQSSAFKALYNIFRPFLTKELKSKLFFHGNDMKSLHRHISPSVLPTVFGGSSPTPTLSSAEWSALLKSFDEEFAKINTYGVKREN